MKLGIEVLLADAKKVRELKKKRVSLVCHPASVNHQLEHSFDLLDSKIGLASAFGPQHGVKGEKQDNMVESDDVLHPISGIPIFSLYGKVRRPTKQMMDSFDVVLFDLQDLGCRIYTFATTLLYVMEECSKHGKAMIVLDRPNPAGREVEGFRLEKGWESFVGAACMPMRHGMTVGELALYYKNIYKLSLDLQIIKMQGYKPLEKPGFGWPAELVWVNPSPNAPTLNMARVYSGTVLIEGCNLSEGRGTTRALELVGAADIDFAKVYDHMKAATPKLFQGALFRNCFFEPTFHKYHGKLCSGIQMHTDFPQYNPGKFKPFRFVAQMLKSVYTLYPKYSLFRDFAYEYVEGKLAFDVINGGSKLRTWIEDPSSSFKDLDEALKNEEASWKKETKKLLLY